MNFHEQKKCLILKINQGSYNIKSEKEKAKFKLEQVKKTLEKDRKKINN